MAVTDTAHLSQLIQCILQVRTRHGHVLVGFALRLHHLVLVIHVSLDAILFFLASPPLLVPLSVTLMLLEEFLFDLGNIMQQHVHFGIVEAARSICQIVTEARQQILVDEDDRVDGTLTNAQTGQMRQEIVADEEAEENEVINDALEVKRKWQRHVLELEVEILTQHRQLDELELDFLRGTFRFLRLQHWGRSTAMVSIGRLALRHSLSQDIEVRIVRCQAQHDQISIGTMDTVRRVRIVVVLGALRSNKVEDLVLAFAGHESIREYNLKILPFDVGVQAFHNVQLDGLRQVVHEIRAGSDDV